MNIKGHTKVGLYEKDGYKYYNVTDTKITFSISKLKVNLQNLFNGLKELGLSLIITFTFFNAFFFLTQIFF